MLSANPSMTGGTDVIALIVIACIAGYLFIGGMIGRYVYDTRFVRCPDCRRNLKVREKYKDNLAGYNRLYSWERQECSSEHGVVGILSGALWPAAIPMFIGSFASERITGGEARSERRQREAAVAHDREMEKLKQIQKNNETSLQVLRANGVNC